MIDPTPLDRIPPQNLEAEAALLGCVMWSQEFFDIASFLVKGADFYSPVNELVYGAATALYAAGKPVDTVSLADEIKSRGMLDTVGGIAYLSSLWNSTPTMTNASVEYYARIVREKAALRGLISAGTRIIELGYEGEADATRAEAEAELTLSRAMRGETTQENPYDAATGVLASKLIDEYVSGKPRETGILSPWSELNSMVGGFMPGELIGWIAAPKVGKSGVVLSLADATASRYGTTVLFAPENGRMRTVERHLALRSGVSARRQRLHEFRHGDVARLIETHRVTSGMPLYVHGNEITSIPAMYRVLRALRKDGPIKSIILDHVGALDEVNRADGKGRHFLIDDAMRQLIKMAREFQCPLHFVQHLNREGYSGEPTAATIKHIRDGGNIEGHADMVIFPHREKPLGTIQEREQGVFIVALTRDGEGGRIPMQYIGARNLWLEESAGGKPWFAPPDPTVDMFAAPSSNDMPF